MSELRTQWGSAPWSRPAFSGSTQALPNRPDVAIIGGGLTGLSTAYHLAKAGTRPVLLEAGLIADGASGRSGGLVLEGTAAGILDQVDRCVPGLKAIVEGEGIDCDLALPGCWEVAHRMGMERTLPWTDDGKPVGIANTVSGGVVQPAALTIGIAKAAQRMGATLVERSPVSRVILERALQVEVRGERIHPGHVVIATNAWINATLPETPPLHSSLTFACATAPMNEDQLAALGVAEGLPFYTIDLPYLWGRTVRDGRMIFGSGLAFGTPEELERFDIGSAKIESTLSQLRTRVLGLHPVLSRTPIDTCWGGPIAFTENWIPILGPHPENPRVLISGGYSGHGVALSVRAGELLASSIRDNSPLPEWGSLSNRAARPSKRATSFGGA
jgi:gamma-glutamylputrescine oxidase